MIQLSFSQDPLAATCRIDCVAGKLEKRLEGDGGGWNRAVMRWVLSGFWINSEVRVNRNCSWIESGVWVRKGSRTTSTFFPRAAGKMEASTIKVEKIVGGRDMGRKGSSV